MQGPQDSTAAAAGHQAQGDLSRGSRDARGQVGADEAHSAGEPKTQRRQRKTKAAGALSKKAKSKKQKAKSSTVDSSPAMDDQREAKDAKQTRTREEKQSPQQHRKQRRRTWAAVVGEKAEGLIATPITGVLRRPAAAGEGGSARSERSDDHTPGGGRKLSFTPVAKVLEYEVPDEERMEKQAAAAAVRAAQKQRRSKETKNALKVVLQAVATTAAESLAESGEGIKAAATQQSGSDDTKVSSSVSGGDAHSQGLPAIKGEGQVDEVSDSDSSMIDIEDSEVGAGVGGIGKAGWGDKTADRGNSTSENRPENAVDKAAANRAKEQKETARTHTASGTAGGEDHSTAKMQQRTAQPTKRQTAPSPVKTGVQKQYRAAKNTPAEQTVTQTAKEKPAADGEDGACTGVVQGDSLPPLSAAARGSRHLSVVEDHTHGGVVPEKLTEARLPGGAHDRGAMPGTQTYAPEGDEIVFDSAKGEMRWLHNGKTAAERKIENAFRNPAQATTEPVPKPSKTGPACQTCGKTERDGAVIGHSSCEQGLCFQCSVKQRLSQAIVERQIQRSTTGQPPVTERTAAEANKNQRTATSQRLASGETENATDGHQLKYQWSVQVKGNKREAVGMDALRDDLTLGKKFLVHGVQRTVSRGQLVGAIKALMAVQGGQVPSTVAGDMKKLHRQLLSERAKVRALLRTREQAERQIKAQQDMLQSMGLPATRGTGRVEDITEDEEAKKQASAKASGAAQTPRRKRSTEEPDEAASPPGRTTPPRQTSPPPTPEPPTRMQSARAAVEVIRTRRRQSAVWAAEWLLGEDGDYLRQPCKVGLLEGVPYDSRPYVISRYCQAVQDLQWATEAYEKEATDANRKVMLGTWTILLRVFPLALCRDRGGGGKIGARKIRAVARVWDEGDYAAAIAHKESARAKRRVGASQPTKKQLFKRVTKYGRQGRLSRMCAAFDAAPVAPGDADTVKTLKTLSPPTFVPMECPRREAVQTAVRENKKRNRVKLKPEDVAKAVHGMPKSATTWTPVGLMRAVVRTKEGIRRLTWLMDKIVNADVPKEIRPLIFDSKRVALRKDSQHQLSIARLEAAASEDQCHTCGPAKVGQLDAMPESPRCQRCGRSHASDVSCAPALWAGEHPDEIPSGERREPTAEELRTAELATMLPHPRHACTAGPDGSPCAACRAAPARPQHPSANRRPIDVPGVEMKIAERILAVMLKERMATAMMPHQVGVAVPGGITMLTTAVEAALRGNPEEMRKLDEDLKNCFCEIDRTGMLEDLISAPEELGQDFNELLSYVNMAYGSDATFGGWFWLEATPQEEGQWIWLKSEEGVRQGAPLSCFLCGLVLKRAQRAAEFAIDSANGHARNVAGTPAEKRDAYNTAAEDSGAAGYLDDSTFWAAWQRLGHGHAAYHQAVIQRNGVTVPKKSVMSGDW